MTSPFHGIGNGEIERDRRLDPVVLHTPTALPPVEEMEVRLTQIIDSAMDAIITIDESQRILLFNHAAEMMFRCSSEEAIGSEIHRFLPDHLRDAHASHIRKFANTNVTTRTMGTLGTLVGRRADGEEFPIEAAISQVYAGKRKFLTVILRDNGPRLAAQAEQARLAAIVKSSSDAIVSKSLDGTVTSWNPAAERLFGYTAQEMIGRSIATIVPEDYLEDFHDILVRVAQQEEIEHHETVRQTKSGRRIEVSISVSAITDQHGAVIGAAKIARDITAQKQNEAHLRLLSKSGIVVAASKNYAETLDQIASLVVSGLSDWCVIHIIDESGNLRPLSIKHFDPAKERMLRHMHDKFPYQKEQNAGSALVARTGKSILANGITDEMLAKTVEDPEQFELVREAGAAAVVCVPLTISGRSLGAMSLMRAATGPDFDEADLAIAEELGRRCALAYENARLFNESLKAAEEIKKLNIILERRINERTAELKQANQILEMTNRDLQIANNELDSFSYSVSHDLRAPLRAMGGFAKILQEEHGRTLPIEGQHYVQRIRHNAAQMGALVDDLLALSRLGRQPLSKRTVSVSNIALQVFNEQTLERGSRTIDFMVDELPLCDADPALMKQVMYNLISNALKFTRVRDVAKIQVGWSSPSATRAGAFFVKDNGVGFDMTYANKLFSVFQRLHRTEDFEGTGVGLAIVQRVINRHGGTVFAEGELDRGATIGFCLPIRKGTAELGI